MTDPQPDDAYFEVFPALAGISLEDSWVLGITVTERGLGFRLDAVLTNGHPGYAAPLPDEQHCYRRGLLTIGSDQPISYAPSGARPATDAAGEIDFGHIDSFVPSRGSWQLDGDWGTATVQRPTLILDLD